MSVLEHKITVKQAIICLIISTFATVLSVHELNVQSSSQAVQSRYQFDVDNYVGCVIRQYNTKIGNDRGVVLKTFLGIAARGRMQAAKDFQASNEPGQAKINFKTGKQEIRLKTKVINAAYTYCPKPPVPSGVDSVKLPKAPYNAVAKKNPFSVVTSK